MHEQPRIVDETFSRNDELVSRQDADSAASPLLVLTKGQPAARRRGRGGVRGGGRAGPMTGGLCRGRGGRAAGGGGGARQPLSRVRAPGGMQGICVVWGGDPGDFSPHHTPRACNLSCFLFPVCGVSRYETERHPGLRTRTCAACLVSSHVSSRALTSTALGDASRRPFRASLRRTRSSRRECVTSTFGSLSCSTAMQEKLSRSGLACPACFPRSLCNGALNGASQAPCASVTFSTISAKQQLAAITALCCVTLSKESTSSRHTQVALSVLACSRVPRPPNSLQVRRC